MAVTNSPKTARKGGRLLKQLLAPLVGDASPVMVIGLCKNAGKTTAMRRLMAELGEECLGLTSVGRDGECTDLVTGTEKPDLYLKKGDLFATARGMLTLCDATLEVVDLTDVMTPLGPVAVFRTLSDGYVQLAGPSAAGQLPPLTRRFQELGAQRVLIDGAAGRKSLAGPAWRGWPCCAPARPWTGTWSWWWRRPPTPAGSLPANGRKAPPSAPPWTARRPASPCLPRRGSRWSCPWRRAAPPSGTSCPGGPGALGGGGHYGPPAENPGPAGRPTTLVAADATHVLAGRAALDLFLRNGGELRVRRELTIAAVGANPWSAYGWHFEPDKFVRALREVIDLPVVNVKED